MSAILLKTGVHSNSQGTTSSSHHHHHSNHHHGGHHGNNSGITGGNNRYTASTGCASTNSSAANGMLMMMTSSLLLLMIMTRKMMMTHEEHHQREKFERTDQRKEQGDKKKNDEDEESHHHLRSLIIVDSRWWWWWSFPFVGLESFSSLMLRFFFFLMIVFPSSSLFGCSSSCVWFLPSFPFLLTQTLQDSSPKLRVWVSRWVIIIILLELVSLGSMLTSLHLFLELPVPLLFIDSLRVRISPASFCYISGFCMLTFEIQMCRPCS